MSVDIDPEQGSAQFPSAALSGSGSTSTWNGTAPGLWLAREGPQAASGRTWHTGQWYSMRLRGGSPTSAEAIGVPHRGHGRPGRP